jgi:hypothetical protein
MQGCGIRIRDAGEGKENRLQAKVSTLDFSGRFDILLEMRLSGIVKQEYTMLYEKSQYNELLEKQKR